MSTAVKDYSAYLKQLSDAKKRKDMAALLSAYETSVARLQQAGSGLDGEYRQAKNAAAGASEQAGRSFAQYAAANGLANGAAGQARLARTIALQNDLAALDREKEGKQADLNAQKEQAFADYETGKAQVEADAEAELAQNLYKEQVRQEEAAYEAARDAVKDVQWQKEQDYQASRDAAKDEQWQKELDFAIRKYWYDKGYLTVPSEQTQSPGGSGTAAAADLRTVAAQVIRGEWGNGAERRNRLTAAGYDYAAVQSLVDALLAGK